MEFKKRLLVVIGIPLSICLILAVAIFFIGSDITNKAKHSNEQRLNFISRLAIADSLASLKKDSEQIKSYSFILENVMPQRDRLVIFPRDLSGIGRQNGLDINITLGQGAASGANANLWYTNFKLTGRGSLESAINFIKSLNISTYLINLRSIDFTREGDNFKTLIDGQVFSL